MSSPSKPFEELPTIEVSGPPPGTRNYLVSGVDASGKRRFERVAATSAKEALERMGAMGYTEIQLQTDDVTRSFGGGGADVTGLTPKQLSRGATRGVLESWLFRASLIYRQSWVWLLILVLVFILRRVRHVPLNWRDGLFAFVMLSPFVLSLPRPGTPLALLRRVQKHYIRGRYQEAMTALDAFEAKTKAGPTKAASMMAVIDWRSRLLAKMGKTEEAMQQVEVARTLPDGATAMYLHTKAVVYSIRREYDKSLECYEELVQKEPQNPLGWLGMIDVLARHLSRPAEARECLRRVKDLPLSVNTQSSMPYNEAIICLAENRFGDAKVAFEAVLPTFEKAAKTTPFVMIFVCVLRAQLAICCAKVGDMEAARRHFKWAEPILKIHGDEALLTRCRAAVGEH